MMSKELTLPAPESPTSTIFSRFSADSSWASDMKAHDEAAGILGSHTSGMARRRPPRRSLADYSAAYNVATRVLWPTNEVRIDRRWWPARRCRRRHLLVGMNKLANNR